MIHMWSRVIELAMTWYRTVFKWTILAQQDLTDRSFKNCKVIFMCRFALQAKKEPQIWWGNVVDIARGSKVTSVMISNTLHNFVSQSMEHITWMKHNTVYQTLTFRRIFFWPHPIQNKEDRRWNLNLFLCWKFGLLFTTGLPSNCHYMYN